MIITASIRNTGNQNDIVVSTENNNKKINIPAKPTGSGSSVNGGELLFLSLATCFCNDIYREAAKRKMSIDSVEVTVSGKFGNEGEPASYITYEADVRSATCSAKQIDELINDVDKMAEIHNTLRRGIDVSLKL